MSTLNVDALVGNTSANAITVRGEGTATTSLQQGLAKAWVNFDGTGTVSIRDDLNTTSITDNAVSSFTMNITNAMANTNCSPVTAGQRFESSTSYAGKIDANMASSSTVRLLTGYEDTLTGQIATDLDFNHIAVFGDLA
tara:strand:- start:297 stop:713 length:417 start_codon:yes stop_codon:yes gene_type:complete